MALISKEVKETFQRFWGYDDGLAYSIEQSCLEADLLFSALALGNVSSVGHLASSS
jgi:hypothetical protein